jgi:hypothetical protein
MATYRAEFLSHYYEGRRRPLNAYAFGMVDRWLELASIAPGLANFATDVPGLSHLMRRSLHIAPERQLPKVAPMNFRKWARRNNVRTVGSRSAASRWNRSLAKQVILWVDTFSNHFHPERVRPRCGSCTSGVRRRDPESPLVLPSALRFRSPRPREAVSQTVAASLGDAIDAGVPIVVPEPSCASVFRDDSATCFRTTLAQRVRSQTVLCRSCSSRRVMYEAARLARRSCSTVTATTRRS